MELTDEQVDRVDDAIEDAMSHHEPLDNDCRCSCGVKNNMDGDVLFTHRFSEVSDAVHRALASFSKQ